MKYLLFLAVLIPSLLSGQLSGHITDQDGTPLPFVSIYIKGSTQGTTSNMEGDYFLNLTDGSHEIVFQYVGMQTMIENVSMSNSPITLNVTMSPQAALLQEVVVAADAEDPAYRVVREAQKKRKYYQNQIKQFTCDVYVKGNQKLLDAPEKIMGVEVGDFEGALDSNRQGIVYLSESISKLYYKEPHEIKEVVYSSKVSGDDRGYSFNTAREMEYNPYDKTLDFNRNFISPIAENAFSYYDYVLEGTFYENGHLVNQIKIIRKRDSDPSFYGRMYIIENLWSLHSLKVGVTAAASQLYFIDSLEVEQVFVPIQEPDVWRIFTNNISFKMGMLGFQLKGYFSATYSNYDLETPISDDIFNKEVFIVEKDSNKKDSTYWSANRPTPLTQEERKDYVVKDSIQKVRDTPEYKDSVDRESNQFKIGDILGGYSYSRRSKNTYWSISSPLSAVSYNTVQGFRSNLDMRWRRYYDAEETRRLIIDGSLGYGLSEKKWRTHGSITYRPNRLDRSYILISGGSDIQDINKYAPVDNLRNTLYSLVARQNYAKYYDYSYAKIGLGKEVSNGITLSGIMGYERRSPLSNHSDFSFFKKEERDFSPNTISLTNSDGSSSEQIWSSHDVFSAEIYADFRIGQEYFVYPDRKFSAGNEGPLIRLKYRLLAGIDNDISLHAATASIRDELEGGARGTTSYYARGGVALSHNNVPVMDRFYVRGNDFTLSNHGDYDRSFLMLPFYDRSTEESFAEVHVQHHFDGYIMDKIPGFNQLGVGLSAGAKALYAKGYDPYYEVHVGLDKIGWHVFRILRVDAVASSDGGDWSMGYRVGVLIK